MFHMIRYSISTITTILQIIIKNDIIERKSGKKTMAIIRWPRQMSLRCLLMIDMSMALDGADYKSSYVHLIESSLERMLLMRSMDMKREFDITQTQTKTSMPLSILFALITMPPHVSWLRALLQVCSIDNITNQ